MTSTIASRRSSSPAIAPVIADAARKSAETPSGTAADMQAATPAATFTPASRSSVPAGSPFNPPRTPALLDESKARSPEQRDAMRTENTSRIGIYNDMYSGYLDRYADAVKSAPDLETVRGFGRPVSYDPEAKLPVQQRAQYDHLVDPALANQKPVHLELGARVLKEQGVELPALHAFFEGQVTRYGNGVKGRLETTDEGVKRTAMVGAGASSAMVAHGHSEVAATVWVDPSGGEKALEIEGSHGGLWGALEANNEGKIAAEGGVTAGTHDASVKAGVHIGLNAAEGNVDLAPVVGASLLGNEMNVKAGVSIQMMSPQLAKAAIDGGDFYADKAQVNAMRIMGR